MTNAAITVAGTTKDNAAVTNVLCQLNEAAWTNAFTTNGWTNWTAAVTLTPGPNTVKAYALDSGGNASHTNSVTFDYVLTAPLTVQVTPPGYRHSDPRQQRAIAGHRRPIQHDGQSGQGLCASSIGHGPAVRPTRIS